MTLPNRRELILQYRNQLQQQEPTWRALTQPRSLMANLVRLGFLLMVTGVLLSVWLVSSAHLEEQFLGAPREVAGLIDPEAGRNALTPDNIEKWVLAYSLRLREAELEIPAGDDPRQRPFVINLGEPARIYCRTASGQWLCQ